MSNMKKFIVNDIEVTFTISELLSGWTDLVLEFKINEKDRYKFTRKMSDTSKARSIFESFDQDNAISFYESITNEYIFE